MHACPRCRLSAELERRARLVSQEVEAARDALRYELRLDERLELVAEEVELERLLARIEERRFALAGADEKLHA
jgi:hypothetical protein